MDRITELNKKTRRYKIAGYIENGTFLKSGVMSNFHSGYMMSPELINTLKSRDCSIVHFETKGNDGKDVIESEFEDWLINSVDEEKDGEIYKRLHLQFWREPLESRRIDNKERKTRKQEKEEQMATINMHDPDEQRFCRKCESLTGREPIMNCQSGRFWVGNTLVPTRRKVQIYIVAEAPGRDEIADPEGRFLIGRSGRELDDWLYDAGINSKGVYVDNVARCAFPMNLGEYKTQQRNKVIKNCSIYLYSEIARLKPEIIILMGNVALQALIGVNNITRWTGRHIHYAKTRSHLVPMLHPAAILRGHVWERDRMVQILRYVKGLIGKPHKFKEPKYTFILWDKDFDKCIKELKKVDRFVVDLETVGADNFADTAKVIGIALGTNMKHGYFLPLWKFKPKEDGGITWDFDSPKWSKSQINEVNKLFKSKKKVKIMHNAGFDVNWLLHFDFDIQMPIWDTIIANSVLDNIDNGLKELSYVHTDFGGYEDELKNALKFNVKRMDLVDPTKLARYACYDAVATTILDKVQMGMIKGHNAEYIINELMESRYNFSKIELTGCLLDLKMAKKLKIKYQKEQEKVKENLLSFLRVKELNLNSPAQLLNILYDPGNILSEYIRNDKDRSTDKKGMQDIERRIKRKRNLTNKNQRQLDIIKGISEYRKIGKLIATYLNRFLKCHVTKRVHTNFKLFNVRTGRTSSDLQNIPREGGIRDCFIAEKDSVLIELDHSQLELRIAAELSQDERMLSVLNDRKGDIHSQVGQASFKKQDGSDHPVKYFMSGEQRIKAKAVAFSIVFGKTPMGLSFDLDCSIEEAAKIQNFLLEGFPGLKKLITYQHAFVAKYGYVETIFGRRFYLDDIHSNKKEKIEGALRRSINYPIQSPASDLVLIAKNRLMKRIKKEKWDSKILLLVHDSNLFQVKKSFQKEFIPMATEEMERSIPQIRYVKLYVDCKVGRRWGTMKEIKNNI